MSMTIDAAAARISRQLPEAEVSLDTALLASARLMESMLLARGVGGMQLYAAQTALMRLAKTQRSLIESQNDMIRVHKELLRVGREVKAVGDDNGDCPKESATLKMEPLRLQA